MSKIVTTQGCLFNCLSAEYLLIEWFIDQMKKGPEQGLFIISG